MMEVLAVPRQWTLERAVREWARSDPAVGERVRKSDRWVNRAVLQAFVDAGFSGADAEVRARGLFYAGVGFLHTASERDLARGVHERQAFLEILLARRGPKLHRVKRPWREPSRCQPVVQIAAALCRRGR